MKYDLFDTHAHYTDKRFETEQEGGAEGLLCALFANGVGKIVNVATNYENALEVIEQSKKYNGMYAAVGIHPTDCKDCGDIETEMERLEALLQSKEENKIVAIGEIGFDYYWEPLEKELQYEYFYRQMCFAERYGLPVVIHDREAHGDTFDMLMRFPKVRGILHSCSASAEMVRQLCRTGNWYISFSGTVTNPASSARSMKMGAGGNPSSFFIPSTSLSEIAS